MEKDDGVNIEHYRIFKKNFVTRSMIVSELFTIVHGFDVLCTIRLSLNYILNLVVPIHV